ncbi:hypothetical protein LDI20_001344 [Campylobacter lari]|nr:hypothetical protein [Campylobacter lari]EIE4560400.1 hypothetical protein [Campylobacter lari]EIE4566742.1 hypothetical protein [Campylobacter lari]EIE4610106.1 hypothetical protein [Campylobacter lari]
MSDKEIKLKLSYSEMLIVKEVFENFVRVNQNINVELGRLKGVEEYIEILQKIKTSLDFELKSKDKEENNSSSVKFKEEKK